MSIASEITRLQNAKSSLKTAIENKGVSVSSSTKLDGYASLVDSISGGGGGGGGGTDWESIARGMLDCTTEFSVPDSIQLSTNVSLFINRKGLLRFAFPAGVTTVASSLCYGCSKLSEVEFPNTITRINQTAFQLTGLTSVTIPSSVTRIDAQAFAQSRLVEVIMEPTTPPTFGGNVFIGCIALTSIYVPDASVDAYKAATNWSTYADKIKPISQRPT